MQGTMQSMVGTVRRTMQGMVGTVWGRIAPSMMGSLTNTITHHTQTDADNATWCAPLAIVVSTDWWLHKFTDDKWKESYLWDRPDVLWDTDRYVGGCCFLFALCVCVLAGATSKSQPYPPNTKHKHKQQQRDDRDARGRARAGRPRPPAALCAAQPAARRHRQSLADAAPGVSMFFFVFFVCLSQYFLCASTR